MRVNVKVTTAPRINTSIKKVSVKAVKLEDLLNVIEPDGLQNGFTVVYDSTLGQWVCQPIAGVSNVDGGSY